jgi:hypothetical protein
MDGQSGDRRRGVRELMSGSIAMAYSSGYRRALSDSNAERRYRSPKAHGAGRIPRLTPIFRANRRTVAQMEKCKAVQTDGLRERASTRQGHDYAIHQRTEFVDAFIKVGAARTMRFVTSPAQ